MGQDRKRVLFDARTIGERVQQLGKEISAKYPQGNLLFVGILKGSFMFMADLVRCLDVSCEVDFVRISTYGSETVSSGELKVIMDVSTPIEGRDVILVDDIVDTGLTLAAYREMLLGRSPRSLEVAALIDKTERREKSVQVDYCGFRVPGGFIIGYGLDCNEQGRQHAGLYVLE
ncbi:MAG: hypoxanthine phosphoribosyltransferase [Thermodesulfobacteriota bacterium]